MENDIRWIQRFHHFLRAFKELQEAVEYSQTKLLNKLEKQGLIQGFEYTHELSWKVIKDYLEDQGVTGLIGSKDSVRTAFRLGLISDGEIWMEMIKARNLSSHTYDIELAEEVLGMITQKFYPVFHAFAQKFAELVRPEEE
jgi:nucleotidyltransferase substrate binding protein (TIGR01987 family)